MIQFLFEIDLAIFRFFNVIIANPVFDAVFPWLTDLNKQKYALVVLAGGLFWLLVKDTRKGAVMLLVLAVAIFIADSLVTSFLKEILGRSRPCQDLIDLRLLVPCGPGKSFPSGHAVNNFAGAYVLSLFYPRFKGPAYAFAGCMAFSRVYVGVHYPVDVASGALIGTVVAWVISIVVLRSGMVKHFGVQPNSIVQESEGQ